MRLRALHRRLGSLLALAALAAFVSGAGLEAPSILPAGALLLLSLFVNPPERLRASAELGWRFIAVLLALRAAWYALFTSADVVLPMVDLLLLLVLAETFRAQDWGGEARLYALTFALLIAAAAYRPGIVFAVAWVSYCAILTVALIVGELARRARDRREREPRLARRFLWQSALISSVVVLTSALVFLAFPRVTRGWTTRSAPAVRHLIGFSERVSLLDHGARLEANPEIVFRAELAGGVRLPPEQLYWRGRSYDAFDGWSWRRTRYLPTPRTDAGRWPGERIEQVIYQRMLGDAAVLFGISPLLRVEARSRIVPHRERNGDYSYVGGDQPVYAVWSIAGLPPADSLRTATGQAGRPRAAFLRLPPLSRRIHDLADSLARGHESDYERAIAVRDWLRTNFSYTIELPATAREASLEHFLFERRAGHCEYFSTAMAVLLRAMGVPTRNVNGFLGGEWNEFGNYYTVTQNQAHSWVEVWFPGYGWVPFDPTPAGSAGALQAAQGWRGPLRRFFDGLEHRWGKWVLDFGIETQASMVRRAGQLISSSTASPAESEPASQQRVRLLAAGGILLLGLALARGRLGVRGRARRSGYAAGRGAGRIYLRLRRAYARRGWAPAALPPLAFAERLQLTGAPGAGEACAAVALYLGVRFGRQPYDAGQRRALRRHARAALAALKRARRAGAGRPATAPARSP